MLELIEKCRCCVVRVCVFFFGFFLRDRVLRIAVEY